MTVDRDHPGPPSAEEDKTAEDLTAGRRELQSALDEQGFTSAIVCTRGSEISSEALWAVAASIRSLDPERTSTDE